VVAALSAPTKYPRPAALIRMDMISVGQVPSAPRLSRKGREEDEAARTETWEKGWSKPTSDDRLHVTNLEFCHGLVIQAQALAHKGA